MIKLPDVVEIEAFPPGQMRYKTAGDWYYIGNILHVNVVKMEDGRHEFLLAVHEFVEAMLCRFRVIDQKLVDKWDSEHPDGEGIYPESGDIPGCPYRRDHRIAMIIEQQLAHELGIDWFAYEEKLDQLLKFQESKSVE